MPIEASGRSPAPAPGSAARRDELNPQPVEFVEVGVGRQLGIENQFFFRVSPRPFLPEPDEAEALIILLILTQFTIGVAKDTVSASCRRKARMPFCRRLRLDT